MCSNASFNHKGDRVFIWYIQNISRLARISCLLGIKLDLFTYRNSEKGKITIVVGGCVSRDTVFNIASGHIMPMLIDPHSEDFLYLITLRAPLWSLIFFLSSKTIYDNVILLAVWHSI